MPPRSRISSLVIGIALSIAAIGVATAVMLPLRDRVNSTTVTLVYLLAVVILSSVFESWVAITASIFASLLLNFFFIPPYHTLTIDEPQNFVSLVVFLAVAITVGHLSATSNRRRAEAERLYKEIEEAFEKASEAEGIKRSEKLKSALLDAVTHDFRTPLTSIKASVTMLIEENEFGSRETKLDRHSRAELLEVINEEADRLNTFVDSMVEVARFQVGQTELRLSTVAADEIIVKAARHAKDVRRTHELISHVEAELPKMAVDTHAIVEALYNLIDNAAKYSDAGTPIAISAKSANGKIRFSIEDQGPGIPAAERETVFQRFQRGEDANGRKQGMGMGLAIVRGIIEAHGGEIWVESGAKGARFVFDLPAGNDGREKKILAVDDEPQILRVLRHILNAHGYVVRTAEDGTSALDVLHEWPPDLVLTDLQMPDMDGLQLCKEIRSISEVPIVILSVRDEEETIVETLDAGADDYITKPFGTSELLARLRSAFRRAPKQETTLIEAGDFSVDLSAHIVRQNGHELRLTPKEFDLLTVFLRNLDRVLTHSFLLQKVWGSYYTEQPESLRVLVGSLRKKIEADPSNPQYIQTEPWIGYRFFARSDIDT